MVIDKNKLALIIDQVTEDHCNVNTREFRDDLVEKIYDFLTPAQFIVKSSEILDIEYALAGGDGSIVFMSLGDITIEAKSVELKAG